MSARERYGQRRLHISMHLLERFFVDQARIRTTLPNDARLVRMYPVEDKNIYIIIFESVEWDELSEGETIPRVTCEVTEEPISLVVNK